MTHNIIPQEKPKMTECYFIPSNNTSSATICGNCGQEKFFHTIGKGVKTSKLVVIKQEEPKQETLEEAAYKNCKKSGFNNTSYASHCMQSFINGAKWQAERMYSEEELEVAFFEGRENTLSFNEWFEQFKNK